MKVASLVIRLIDPEVAAKLWGTAAEEQVRQRAADLAAFREPQGRA